MLLRCCRPSSLLMRQCDHRVCPSQSILFRGMEVKDRLKWVYNCRRQHPGRVDSSTTPTRIQLQWAPRCGLDRPVRRWAVQTCGALCRPVRSKCGNVVSVQARRKAGSAGNRRIVPEVRAVRDRERHRQIMYSERSWDVEATVPFVDLKSIISSHVWYG